MILQASLSFGTKDSKLGSPQILGRADKFCSQGARWRVAGIWLSHITGTIVDKKLWNESLLMQNSLEINSVYFLQKILQHCFRNLKNAHIYYWFPATWKSLMNWTWPTSHSLLTTALEPCEYGCLMCLHTWKILETLMYCIHRNLNR
jgi:hypothetical protein